jgi:streptogramin lyase
MPRYAYTLTILAGQENVGHAWLLAAISPQLTSQNPSKAKWAEISLPQDLMQQYDAIGVFALEC